MRAFIKAIDERAWRSILTGWTHLTTTDSSNNVTLKPEETWSTDEDRIVNYNSKALNAIFNAVHLNQFKLISTCESAKEAWNVLQIAHEGTTAVKVSKPQILTTRFEQLKMREDECIANFNSKLCDIANESFALGKKYSDAKLVRKTLRPLLERFAYKVAAIEEAKDVDSMKLDELMGSLRTFELKFKKDKKENGMAFRSGVESQSNQEESEDEGELEESLARLTNNFKKILKKLKKKGNFKDFSKTGKQRFNSQGSKQTDSDKKGRGIQCRECDGYGHIQAECANTLKKKKNKAMKSTWSDDESSNASQDEDEEHNSNFVAFNVTTVLSDGSTTSKDASVAESVGTEISMKDVSAESEFDTYTNSEEEDIDIEEVQKAYEKMYSKWTVVCKVNISLEEQVKSLNKEKGELQAIVTKYESEAAKNKRDLAGTRLELERTQRNLRLLNSGTTKLDHLLSQQKASTDHAGLGYTGESSGAKSTFVKATNKSHDSHD